MRNIRLSLNRHQETPRRALLPRPPPLVTWPKRKSECLHLCCRVRVRVSVYCSLCVCVCVCGLCMCVCAFPCRCLCGVWSTLPPLRWIHVHTRKHTRARTHMSVDVQGIYYTRVLTGEGIAGRLGLSSSRRATTWGRVQTASWIARGVAARPSILRLCVIGSARYRSLPLAVLASCRLLSLSLLLPLYGAMGSRGS